MFTGIIEQQGKVLTNKAQEKASRLVISSAWDGLQSGESIAVNGVCLTLLPSSQGQLHFDVSPETMQVTTLGRLKSGDLVNLERAMSAATRFGGHYVSGHVDSKAQVSAVQSVGDYIEMTLTNFSPDAFLWLVPKGSITVEGVSLTINAVTSKSIQLMLIPHTLSITTLGLLKSGQEVNIEFDYLTRVVAHQLQRLGQLNHEVTL